MGKRRNVAKWYESQKCWQVKVRKDGERKAFRSYKPGIKGKYECHDKADAWLDDGIIDGGTKVSVLYEKWIDELKATTSKSNWRNAENFGKNYIIPKIGNKRIQSVNEGQLQDLILYAFENPASKAVAKEKAAKTGKSYAYREHLSAKTLKDIRGCLIQFIKYCRKRKATTLFPEDITIPKSAPKSNKGTLQPVDLQILFKADKTTYRNKIVQDWYINAYRYAVITGMRPGEILGLMKSDFPQKRNICIINRSVNTYGEETDGKNKNAQRSYIVPEIGKKILQDQADMMKAAGIISPYIFPAPDGNRSNQITYRKYWRRYREYNGLSDRTPYELRHTWFSVNKEIPVELLKPMGGHGKDFDSQGTYGHAIDGEAEKTAQMIDNVFAKLLQ